VRLVCRLRHTRLNSYQSSQQAKGRKALYIRLLRPSKHLRHISPKRPFIFSNQGLRQSRWRWRPPPRRRRKSSIVGWPKRSSHFALATISNSTPGRGFFCGQRIVYYLQLTVLILSYVSVAALFVDSNAIPLSELPPPTSLLLSCPFSFRPFFCEYKNLNQPRRPFLGQASGLQGHFETTL